MFRKAGLISMLVLIFVVGTCSAQNAAQGFIFAAPGGATGGSSTLHLGGGLETFLNRSGFALGGDLGYLAPMTHMGSGIGLLDLDAGYHFALQDKKVTPFLSGGYSLGFRDGAFNAFNLGGGVNFWMTHKTGLRIELRDVKHPETSTRAGFSYVNVRIGLTFR